MKKYKITKIIYGRDLSEALAMLPGGETIETVLMDEVKESCEIGFTKSYGPKNKHYRKR